MGSARHFLSWCSKLIFCFRVVHFSSSSPESSCSSKSCTSSSTSLSLKYTCAKSVPLLPFYNIILIIWKDFIQRKISSITALFLSGPLLTSFESSKSKWRSLQSSTVSSGWFPSSSPMKRPVSSFCIKSKGPTNSLEMTSINSSSTYSSIHTSFSEAKKNSSSNFPPCSPVYTSKKISFKKFPFSIKIKNTSQQLKKFFIIKPIRFRWSSRTLMGCIY